MMTARGMTRRLRGGWLLGVTLIVGCGDTEPKPGEEGGTCRISYTPCDPGLVCTPSGCDTPRPPDDGGVPELNVEWQLEKMSLHADGKETVIAVFDLTERESGEPYAGDVRVWIDPASAGVVQPPRVELDEEGHGVTRLTVCDGRNPACPMQAAFKIAVIEEPLVALSASPIIRILGTGQAPGGGPDEIVLGGGTGGTTTGDFVIPSAFTGASRVCTGAEGALDVRGGTQLIHRRALGSIEPSETEGGAYTAQIVGGASGDGVLVNTGGHNEGAPAPILGCGADEVHKGTFAVPAATGVKVLLPNDTERPFAAQCTVRQSGAQVTPGSGSGKVFQAVRCEGEQVVEWLAAFDVICEETAPDVTRRPHITGCMRYISP